MLHVPDDYVPLQERTGLVRGAWLSGKARRLGHVLPRWPKCAMLSGWGDLSVVYLCQVFKITTTRSITFRTLLSVYPVPSSLPSFSARYEARPRYQLKMYRRKRTLMKTASKLRRRNGVTAIPVSFIATMKSSTILVRTSSLPSWAHQTPHFPSHSPYPHIC
jgi:hypothetical protein